MITIESSGDFKNTNRFLKRMTSDEIFQSLARYGQEGVKALANATPVDTGQSADSWSFEIKKTTGSYSIIWSNSNIVNGTPVVVFIQYGHGTGTGGYVEGIDFINPALRPIFDRIASDVWKEVTKP